MSETVKFPPRELTSSEQLSKFVTRVWMHPLLTQQTIEHRDEGLKFLEGNLDRDCVNQVGFLTGSSLWIVDASSDYDGVIITPANGVASYWNVASLSKGQLFFGIDDSSELATHLLFTPDDLLVGDVDYARKLRLKMVLDAKAQQNWQTASNQFRVYGTEWRLFEKHDTTKRINRFKAALEEYSFRYKNPENAKENFTSVLDAFTLPDLSTYQYGLMQTQGRLSLSEKYIFRRNNKR